MDFGTNKILVSGANGWLGKTLIDCLLNGVKNSKDLQKSDKSLKIKCLVLNGENTTFLKELSKNISTFNGDITNEEDCKLFTEDSKDAILFHCAGIIHPRNTNQFFEINVKGTNNVLKYAAENGVKKVVVVSSNSPCGTNPNNSHRFDESSKYNPYMKYGHSKMMMEKLVYEYFRDGKLETVIVRPPWFYGPYQPSRQIKFYKMIKDGKVPIIGDGENFRSMACTINISQGLIRSAIMPKASGNTYWIADKDPYTFNEIIKTVREVFKNEFNIISKNSVIKLPNMLGFIAYHLDKAIQSTSYYNKEIHVLSEMNKTIACSIKKAENELGYKPTVDLYEGTKLSIQSALSEF